MPPPVADPAAGPLPDLRVSRHLSPAEADEVLALVEAAAEADGARPLSEHVTLHLQHGGDARSIHVVARDPSTGQLLGYAHLDATDAVAGPSAELAVGPWARRRGVGAALLDRLLELGGGGPGTLRLWAHGSDTAAARLAAARGFHRVRRLWQMRRSLYAPLDPVMLPEGVSLRSFDPDADAEEWLALNARAFADLPDQAGWTRLDLQRRIAEDWFDAAGFLLAHEQGGRLVGCHWTKVHGGPGGHGEPGQAHGHEQLGEVYVVAVDPSRRRRGLGRALTLAGLHHMRRAGLGSAMLYVDSENAAGIRLYGSLGFAVWDSDTLFRR